MPIYEYRCSACQNLTEKRQNFSDAPLTTCEACGGPLERLISAPRLHFKGSGWYITDYAKKNGKGSAGDGKGSPTEGKGSTTEGKGSAGDGKSEGAASESKTSEKKTESKSDTKPATPAKSPAKSTS